MMWERRERKFYRARGKEFAGETWLDKIRMRKFCERKSKRPAARPVTKIVRQPDRDKAILTI